MKPLSVSHRSWQPMQPQLEAKDLSQFNQILQSKELAHGWCRIASSNQTQVEPVGVSGWPRLPKPTTTWPAPPDLGWHCALQSKV